jgi:predicted neuraminidase
LHHRLAIFAAVLVFVTAAISARAPKWPSAFAASTSSPSCIGSSVFDIAPFHQGQKYAHATSAVNLRDGRLRAVWYEGARERALDVKIWTATFDGARWSVARPIISPAQASEGSGRYVQRLGNPIIFRDAAGKLVIVFAGLGGIGGWDGASLKLAYSLDDGETWSVPRNLTTAAISNFGTNVRGPALPASGNYTLIPTSHEFARPFPEILLLDDHDRVVGKRRIGINHGGTQPFVTTFNEHRAVAFMRVEKGFTLFSKTEDVGWSWTEPRPTNSPNFDSPVVAARIGNNLFIVSSYFDAATNNWSLNFAISADEGQSWRNIYARQFVGEARYLWLIAGSDGLLHLLFTHARDDGTSELMHARISRDWIAEQGGPACP